MTNLEKLRKIIIKEIPEITRMEIGCKFIGSNGDTFTCVRYKENFAWGRLWRHGELQSTIYKEEIKPKFKIIGRPIRLSDILRVMQQSENKQTGMKKFIRGNAESCGNYGFVRAIELWSLDNDNLNKQSQKTIDFLLNILDEK